MVSFLLNNVFIWKFFRKFLDKVFGLYRKRLLAIKALGINDQMSVIDVGCGMGQFSDITKNQYLGIDLSEEYIDTARAIYFNDQNKQFLCKDLTTAELPEDSYDVAILIDFTHHMGRKELENLFISLNKIVRKYVVFSDPVLQNTKNIWGRALTFLDRGEYFRSEADIITLISKYFNILKVKKISGIGIKGVLVLSKPKLN